MVAYDQDPYPVFYNSKEEVIGKSVEIHTSNITLMNTVGFGRVRSFAEVHLEFSVELIRELGTSDILVVIHNSQDVRIKLFV